MNQQKKDGQPGSQFDSGFGGSMFGGQTGQFGGGQPSQGAGTPGGASQFGGGGGTGAGEFASGFGSTNAVSQIFKEGGFAGDERKKKMLILGSVAAVAVCLGAVYFLFMDDSGATEVTAPTDAAAPVDPAAAAAATEGEDAAATEETEGEEEALAEDEAVEGEVAAAPAPAAPAAAAAAPAVTGASTTHEYNEEQGGPVVSANPGSTIEVARRQDFSDAYVIGKVGVSGQFRIPNPPPGAVYWREQGAQGSNQITVNAPAGLGLSFQAPATLAEGTQLTWSASGPVAFYRLEFATDQGFSSVSHVISTGQSAVSVNGVVAGTYFLRLGGFNRASGKWEYSAGSSVQVQ